MKSLLVPMLIAATLAFTGCTSDPSQRMDPPFAITTFDLNQARWVEDVFKQTPEIKGRFSVSPGAKETLVEFQDDLPSGKEALFVERMTSMKAEMAKSFGRPVNLLVFRFPSKEIKI